MNRTAKSRSRKMTVYPWTVRRYKDKIVIEIARTRIRSKRKPQSTIAPDCKPEIW
jgi:hypothetical protein